MPSEYVEAPRDFAASQEGRRRIAEALSAALESEGLLNAPQLSAFLSHVVCESLAGRAERLNAYAVATEALGRDEAFDPQADPLVRVTARRLRQALDQHNRTGPSAGGVRIELPRGGYAPRFMVSTAAEPERAAALEDAAAAGSPAARKIAPAPGMLLHRLGSFAAPALLAAAVALLAGPLYLWGGGSGPIAEGVLETHSTPPRLAAPQERVFPYLALTIRGGDALPDVRAADIDVVARSVAGRFDEIVLLSKTSPTPPDYRLRLDLVAHSDGAHVFARLERVAKGVVVWSQDFGRATRQAEVNERVGQALGVALSPYGVLYADIADRGEDALHFECVAKAYGFFYRETAVSRAAAQECVAGLIASGVEHPTIYALKAYLHLEAYRSSDPNVFDGAAPLALAQEAAEKAIEIAPRSARAHQAMLDVMKVAGRHQTAARYGASARQANPYDLDILTDVAAYDVSRGRDAEAEALIEQARAAFLNAPAWFEGYATIHYLLKGDVAKAEEAAASLKPGQSTIGTAALALLAHRRGDAPALRAAIEVLLRREPAFADGAQPRLIRRGFSLKRAVEVGRRLDAAILASGLAPRRRQR